MENRASRRGRPRTGSLELRGKTWHARLTVTVDGESVRKWFDLGTDSKPAARRKLSRLLQEQPAGAAVGEIAVAAGRCETVSEAADRILVQRDGVRDIENDRIRFRRHVKPFIGEKSIAGVRSSDIRDVLEEVRSAGRSRRRVVHVRRVLNLIFETLWRDELLPENPVARVKIPSMRNDNRERAVLTDEELGRYLAWEHPDDRHRMAVLERQTMACIARMFGGLRTGDLHALRWESLDTDHGLFRFGWAPRKKTARPQLLEIPELLRPILRDWWQRGGEPSTGLVFPARRGKRAGKGPKIGVSHAEAFRRDLKRAFALETWRPDEWCWKPAEGRPWTARERELFEETSYTKPVDFHSWRRAYSQALAEANVTAQQAQALAGHASLDAHQRYLSNTSKMRAIPEAALPQLRILPRSVPKIVGDETRNQRFSWLRGGATRAVYRDDVGVREEARDVTDG